MFIAAALVAYAIGDIPPPPWPYQDNNGANVQFVSEYELLKVCGLKAAACVKIVGETPIIYVLNPCKVLRKQEYSAILCHELGHINGWKH